MEPGSSTFTERLPEGDYCTAFFIDNGYEEITERVFFSVAETIEVNVMSSSF
jgi:hypothetical protein